LFVVVVAGAFAPILASVVVRNFSVLNESYSGWLFAPLGLLIGVSATSFTGLYFWDYAGRFLALGIMLTGAGVSTYIFLVDASMFVHGPQRFVGRLYDETAGPKAVLYEPGAAWEFSYFPLVFSHYSHIDQYRATTSGDMLIQIGSNVGGAANQNIDSTVTSYNDLLLVDVRLRSVRTLRECLSRSSLCPLFAHSAVEEALAKTREWRVSKVERNFGEYDTQVTILERQ
jgi:hypothetical protein